MAQEDYQLQAFPISLLPSTPAGRIQTVQELINMGVIDSKEQITKLLDYPDLASVTHWMEAAENDIEWRISKILDDEELVAPDSYMNLEFAKSRMQMAYLEAMQQGVDQKKLSLMQIFISQAQALIDEATMPMTPDLSMLQGTPPVDEAQAGPAEMVTESPLELTPEMDTAPPPETLPS